MPRNLITKPSSLVLPRRKLLTAALAAPAVLVFPRGLMAAPAITTWDAANIAETIYLTGSDLTANVAFGRYMMAADFSNSLFWLRNSYDGLWNGLSIGSANPASGIGGWGPPSPSLLGGPYYPGMNQGGTNASAKLNCGAITMSNLPSGFSTANAAAGASVTLDTTWNASGQITYSESNSRSSRTSGGTSYWVRATNAFSSGKVAWEQFLIATNNGFGFMNNSVVVAGGYANDGRNGAAADSEFWQYNNSSTGVRSIASSAMRMGARTGFATVIRTSGRLMFECTISPGPIGSNRNNVAVGVGNSSASLSGNPGGTNSFGYNKTNSGATSATNGSSLGGTDVLTWGTTLGIYIDFGTSELWYYVPATARYNSSATANPATNTGGINISSIMGSGLIPIVGSSDEGIGVTANSGYVTANFGATAFSSPTPAGYVSWNTGASALNKNRGHLL